MKGGMYMKKSSSLRRILSVLLAVMMVLSIVTVTSVTVTSCTKPTADPADTQTDSGTEADTTEGAVTDTDTKPGETELSDTDAPEETDAPAPVTDITAPVFSLCGGLYTEEKTLTVTLPAGAADGTVIRYTKDGSVPVARSNKVTGDIKLMSGNDATVIRAACFDKKGNRISPVVTHTYVKVEKTASSVYTVMISVEEKDLDAMIARAAETIEKPAHVEIVNPSGETVISQDAGLRLFGGSSRSLPQKSFKLIARKDGYFGEDAAYVGSGTFSYPLFPQRTVLAGKNAGEVLEKYDSFILRNGGNDSLLHTACDPNDATLLRDGVVNNFAFTYAPHVSASLSTFAVVYLNGEYYGLLDLRENLNEDYVKRLYGVNDDDVVVIKSELDTSRHCAHHANGGACRFDNVWFYYETDDTPVAQNALKEWTTLCREAIAAIDADETTYRAMYEKVAAAVDLESFKEYMALGLYVCNTDWPHNNVKIWKYTGEAVDGVSITDGKWRFMTRDMDMAMGRYSSPSTLPELDNRASVDTFWRVLGNYLDGYKSVFDNSGETRLYPDSLYLQGLFAFCMRDAEFRASFAAYARTLATEQAVTDLTAQYTAAHDAISSLMAAHTDRWTGDTRTWNAACKKIVTFIKNRPEKFLSYLDRALSMYE